MFRLGAKQLEGEWDPASQFALADTYGAWGAMEADKGDATKGRELLQVADTHLGRADAARACRGAAPAAAGPGRGAPPPDRRRAPGVHYRPPPPARPARPPPGRTARA